LNFRGELLHPVEIIIFYRSNVQAELLEYAPHAVPINIFCRIKEVFKVTSDFVLLLYLDIILPFSEISGSSGQLDISLNENSLDVLLFMIGELKLSGPYSLQSSVILANFCKVVDLVHLYYFYH
jgi:hypothetical protein